MLRLDSSNIICRLFSLFVPAALRANSGFIQLELTILRRLNEKLASIKIYQRTCTIVGSIADSSKCMQYVIDTSSDETIPHTDIPPLTRLIDLPN